MTLEWLLLFAAMIGVGATSVLIVERVVSTSSEVPADIETLAISAEIEAAAIAERANRDFKTDPDLHLDNNGSISGRTKRRFKEPCLNVASEYSAVIATATFEKAELAEPAVAGDPTANPPVEAVPAKLAVSPKCKLTRVSGLAAGG